MATFHDPEFIKQQLSYTKPDYIMFVPRQVEGESDNVHLYVVEHETYGGLLAFWTQSTVEGTGNNHLVMSGSKDGGTTWSEPKFLLGAHPNASNYGTGQMQASWCFPIVTQSERIYLFYYRQVPNYVDNSTQLGNAFSAMYSDDCGETWSESSDIKQRLTPYDWNEYLQDNIVFELPMRGPDGKYLAGFTKYTSRFVPAERRGGTRVYFYRFDNIDDDPEIKDLQITILPADENGIQLFHTDRSVACIEEPAWVTLPDGRIFCSMRTTLGAVYYAVSSDCGLSFTTPKPLYFSDYTPFVHSLSPCPIFDLGDGRYMQLYHGASDPEQPYAPRNPLRCAIGHFDSNAKQPIVFDKKDDCLYMELPEGADGLGYGKELAIYGTMTNQNGKNILWYPDRKFFLLGKIVE